MAGKNADRLARIRRRMEEQELLLVVVGPGADYRYLAGYTPPADERVSLLLIGPESEAAVVPAVNARQTEAGLAGSHVPLFIHRDDEGPRHAIRAAMNRLGVPKIPAHRAALGDEIWAAHVFHLLDILLPGKPVLASQVLSPERMHKDPLELVLLRRSAATADQAMEEAMAFLRPGVTELEVADVIRRSFKSAGGMPEFALVAAGEDSAEPHHEPSTRPLGAGDPVFLDLGGGVEHYQSDLTRMAYLGEPSQAYEQVHELVAAAASAARDRARPGVKASEVDRAARDVIEAAGFGDRFVHRTGHGIGLSVHEPPSIQAGSEIILEQGMTFSIEPGIYLPGKFGVRIEDIVAVTAAGAQPLSRLDRACRVVS